MHHRPAFAAAAVCASVLCAPIVIDVLDQGGLPPWAPLRLIVLLLICLVLLKQGEERWRIRGQWALGMAWIASVMLDSGGTAGHEPAVVESALVLACLYTALGLPLRTAAILGAILVVAIGSAAASQGLGTGSLVWLGVAYGVGFLAALRLARLTQAYSRRAVALCDAIGNDRETGIANCAAFLARYHLAARQAQRSGCAVAVLFVEFDYYADFRAVHGSENAEQSMRRVAQAVASCARRPLDCAARWDDSRFALLLYDADTLVVGPLCARLRARVAVLDIRHAASPIGRPVTVSIGGAVARSGEAADRGLLTLAERALAVAAREGGNRVVFLGKRSGSAARVLRGPWAARPEDR